MVSLLRAHCIVCFCIVLGVSSLQAETIERMNCDPGFEGSAGNGTPPSSGCWTPAWLGEAGHVVTQTAAHTGNNGLWQYTGSASAGWWSGPYQDFTAAPGDVYVATAYGRSRAESWPPSGRGVVQLLFLNQSGGLLQTFESEAIHADDTEWRLLSTSEHAAPIGTTTVRMRLYLEKSASEIGIAVVNFDDCRLGQNIAPPTPSPSPTATPAATPLSSPTPERTPVNHPSTLLGCLLGVDKPTAAFDRNADAVIDASDWIISRGDSEQGLARAYEFLDHAMDQYHESFIVYSDRNAGGNHFPPSGWAGDYEDLTFDDAHSADPAEGNTCIRIQYTATGNPADEMWASVVWQSLENNWGDKGAGIDLRGATRVTFQARGATGEEKVEFFAGGINQPPYRRYPYVDSLEKIAIGPVKLSASWETYSVDLTTPEDFRVYTDFLQASNHCVPSGWHNVRDAHLAVNEDWHDNPHSGSSCVRVAWNGTSLNPAGTQWGGLSWEVPADALGTQGYDLTGATGLSFWARSDEENAMLKFIIGATGDSCGEIAMPGGDTHGYHALNTDWTRFYIPIPIDRDLSSIRLGFSAFFDTLGAHDPGAPGFVFYLDDIVFERPLRKDLSSVIAGFGFAVTQTLNPQGCTFFLDDIRYDRPNLEGSRFLQSYADRGQPDDWMLNNYATTYDNALALMAYTLDPQQDHLRRARILADTFLAAMEKDRNFHDGRLRNAYRSGDAIDAVTDTALLPGWWDPEDEKWYEDKDFVGSKVGDVAWAGLALLRFHRVTEESQYLEATERLGEWIVSNAWSEECHGGFTGGCWGWPEEPSSFGTYAWKSTEHNLDCFRLFQGLYVATGESRWQAASDHALRFVSAMWNEQDGSFFSGTTPEGDYNRDLKALDPNSWGFLCFAGRFAAFGRALDWCENYCIATDGNFWGFDFNQDDEEDGVWFEGTGQMAVAYRWSSRSASAAAALESLRLAQVLGSNADGKGIIAASRSHLGTGMSNEYGPIEYHDRLHVGATCWYIFAEKGYNPFLDEYR